MKILNLIPKRIILFGSFGAAAICLLGASIAFAQSKEAGREIINQVFQECIGNVPGKSITGIIVDYAPGASTPSHRHGKAFVVPYVLSGSIVSRVDDGKETTYKQGEHWTEDPGAHHVVSKNASQTEPAKVLVLFIDDSSVKNFLQLDASDNEHAEHSH